MEEWLGYKGTEGMICQKDARLSDINTGAFILDCLRERATSKPRRTIWIWIAIVGMIAATLLIGVCVLAWAEITETSWYSNVETKGRDCADGKYHDLSKEFVCASWFYPLNTRLNVSTLDGRKNVSVTCVDRGPAKRICKAGRCLDLSAAAFKELAPLSRGVAMVEVTRIGD